MILQSSQNSGLFFGAAGGYQCTLKVIQSKELVCTIICVLLLEKLRTNYSSSNSIITSMPRKGDFQVELIDAHTKVPFQEHHHHHHDQHYHDSSHSTKVEALPPVIIAPPIPDDPSLFIDAHVEVEPNLEYYIKVTHHQSTNTAATCTCNPTATFANANLNPNQNHDDANKAVIFKYKVDGQDLGYYTTLEPGQFANDGIYMYDQIKFRSFVKALMFQKEEEKEQQHQQPLFCLENEKTRDNGDDRVNIIPNDVEEDNNDNINASRRNENLNQTTSCTRANGTSSRRTTSSGKANIQRNSTCNDDTIKCSSPSSTNKRSPNISTRNEGTYNGSGSESGDHHSSISTSTSTTNIAITTRTGSQTVTPSPPLNPYKKRRRTHGQMRKQPRNQHQGIIEVSVYEYIPLDGHYYVQDFSKFSLDKANSKYHNGSSTTTGRRTTPSSNKDKQRQCTTTPSRIMKTLFSTEGKLIQEVNVDSGRRPIAKFGKKLQFFRIEYCSTVGLMYAGILPQPPICTSRKRNSHHVDEESASDGSRSHDILTATVIKDHNGHQPLESKEYDFFDLTVEQATTNVIVL